MTKPYIACIVMALIFCITAPAVAGPTFTFESIVTIDDMAATVRTKFPLGSSRSIMRKAFVEEGRATLVVKKGDANIEKYIYDIDLCHYYIWRWNISADYDSNGKLRQAYINGKPVFANGNPKQVVSKTAAAGKKASIYRVQRPRPEAYKGEKSLGFLLYDRDSDSKTTHDQVLAGAGPSRSDPLDMGNLITYTDVDPWRSIFDFDAADRIVPYQGDCNKVDSVLKTQNTLQKR